jgi:TolB-like protein
MREIVSDRLSGFEARLDSGQKIALPTRKAEALLAYLALAQGKPRTRDQLAGLLWSDRGDAQAKGSLRQALTALRHGLPENGAPAIEADGEAVALEASAVAVDVLAFERLATNGSNGNLAEAGALYHGPLLEGFTARDPAFDEWLAQERARLHALAVGAAERLLAGLLADGDTATAITAAQRLLALEPERESATRTLMRLYAEQGQRGLAARQYETCREVLSSTLGVEPAPATRRLYEEIVGATEPEPAAEPRRHAPLPLPSIPSVAVLPFANLSGDPDQGYLSDGLTEDVITELARFPGLFVIGAASSLALKDRTITPNQVARELGVEYLVEGSVRRAGETLRVTVQLIDPATGHRLWAERYDRPFTEVFAIQDSTSSRRGRPRPATGRRKASMPTTARSGPSKASWPTHWKALPRPGRCSGKRSSSIRPMRPPGPAWPWFTPARPASCPASRPASHSCRHAIARKKPCPWTAPCRGPTWPSPGVSCTRATTGPYGTISTKPRRSPPTTRK